MSKFSLLHDSLLHVDTPDGPAELSLPDVFAALGENGKGIVSFNALQAHQEQPWHAFLVQVAAMTIERQNAVPASAEEWRDALVELADGEPSAWALVEPDLSKPALLQPPVPEGSLDDASFKNDTATPDQLDLLVTSKNHDVKRQRIIAPRPEHWIYALVSLQTMEGFMGAGNYGIARMNGGYGNRPMVGMSSGLSWGGRFRRDVHVLRAHRNELAGRYDLQGNALLWLDDWDGKEGIEIQTCDPYFVEICRRIRFTEDDGALTCWRTTTKGQRIDGAKNLKGLTGDPWTPVTKDGGKALTVSRSGFSYAKLNDILMGTEYQRPPTLEIRGNEDVMYLVAQTLVRGMGETEGFHQRIVPIPNKAVKRLGKKSERERLASRAKARIELADKVQRKILYPSTGTLLGGGDTDAIDSDDVAPWLNAFDDAVNAAFFDQLWASVEMEEGEAARKWADFLWDEAQTQFRDAEQHAPKSSMRFWRARSAARSVFYGSARNTLSMIFEDTTASPSPSASIHS